MESTTLLKLNKIIISKSKLIVFAFVLPFFVFTSCKKGDPISTGRDFELYLRSDAASTLIPLLENKSWKYNVTAGLPVKPQFDNYFIHTLLSNSQIAELKILPVREYDGNSGTGKYRYDALCYITDSNVAFFYMENKILVGQYLYSDAHGNESVTWEFELPTYSPENEERYFILNRLDPSIFLSEKKGYDTVEVQINSSIWKRYFRCKLFEYSVVTNPKTTWINRFYFEEGVGLVRFQQYLKSEDNNPILMYEQSLIEE